MTIEDIKTIEILLDRTGFATKEICDDEGRAIDGFLNRLLNDKYIKAHWIIKEGDKYKYIIDDFATGENFSMGKFFAEYIYKVWGVPACDLLGIMSLRGMNIINGTMLDILSIRILELTNKHRAIIAKLHKIKVEKKIAISKILRNKIYNDGLGLKLAIKAYNNDF